MSEFSHLGTVLKNRRVEKGFTQASLAAALKDVHPQFISNWERGLCAPPAHCFQALLDLLKVNRRAVVEAMVKDARAEIEQRVYNRSKKSRKSAA